MVNWTCKASFEEDYASNRYISAQKGIVSYFTKDHMLNVHRQHVFFQVVDSNRELRILKMICGRPELHCNVILLFKLSDNNVPRNIEYWTVYSSINRQCKCRANF